MTTPRRTGPSPAIVILIAGAISVLAFLGILLLQGPDLMAQLQSVLDSFFPPAAATEQGREIRGLYDLIFWVGAVIFFLVEGLILFAVIRYWRRPGRSDELPPQTHGNNVLEVVWTVVPLAIVLVLFVLSWQSLNSVNATTANPDVSVRAIAARFQWTFEYLKADGETVEFTQLSPEMVVPVNETVHLKLRSPDVNHAFYVPEFLFKRDVIPGQDNNFDFVADQTGTFRGQCAELCGAQHWAMQFTVKVVERAEYDAWFAEQLAAAQETPAPSGEPGQPEGPQLELTAKDIAFDKATLEAPADTAFSIRFQNDDQGVPHNVEIKDASGTSVFKGEIFNGVDSRVYAVPALPAGDYTFICTVHPNMTGTLSVK
jgi:cytochrome c oxidase subunit 2